MQLQAMGTLQGLWRGVMESDSCACSHVLVDADSLPGFGEVSDVGTWYALVNEG